MAATPPASTGPRHPRAQRLPIPEAVAMAAAAALLASGGTAAAGDYNPQHLAPTDHAQVAGLCAAVMGLSRGNAQYDACLEALSDSVRAEAGAQGLARSQADCLSLGAAPGTPALARCELERSRATAQGGAVLPASAPLSSRPARSYWMASNAEVHAREETACADLGLEPVGRPFARCVAGLDASIFNANNPSQ